ncbi:NAD(P)/FAD-dependent oxidoreductase [Pseudodonghicola flavimaris]|uniref:FAD-dependent oxidoreductase n=1 Tax=Pseudodonghicola flavimaris TaxID=3050036 RepID=A0ABT7F2C5_9RHOB|nr:FAD-dependent oxidoreductase [Pseudodonghicola flavimaris]MDK3018756.1 FAD-dependent oxidoreductase [Pseudodonghicola flavimaris]
MAVALSEPAAGGGDVIVLGAGIVGLSTALSLRRRGFGVRLLDAGRPGAGCSFGNAGMIQVGSSLPLAMPGLLSQLPRMLTDPEGPLSLRWGHLPALLPWGRKLVRNMRPEAVARNEAALAALLRQAQAAYRRLTGDTPAAEVFRPRGELYVVRSAAAFAGYSTKIEICRRNGVAVEVLGREDIHALEPLLAPDYSHGIYLPGSSYVVDPQLLSTRLFEQFLAEGGDFETVEIRRGGRDAEGRPQLTGADGRRFGADRLVVATGAAARSVSGWFGRPLPIEPMRGYHVTLPLGDQAVSGPVIEGEMNIAVTPMLTGNRIAGTLEFAGSGGAPNWRRAEMLMPMACRMIPSLTARIETRWSGDRPGTPDSVPVIGPRAGDDRIWYACGHGMLGLTLGARTGELIAAAMAGDAQAAAALAATSPDRF